MAEEVLKSLNLVEHIAKALINTQVNFKKCPKARLTRSYVENRLKCVEDHWERYQRAYETIIRNTPKEKQAEIAYIKNDIFFEHEELYISVKSDFMELLGSEQDSTALSTPSDVKETRVMLPKIQIPTFSGQYEDWMSFHDLFTALVHSNKSLSNAQKLHYLKTSLTGEAEAKLKHIKVTDSNYQEAWDILKTRYGNKRININAVMKRFFSQKKITLSTSSNIKGLLDTSFECLHHLNNMEVKTENWDAIIIFVMVQKLDGDTHREWENHVSNTEDLDTLPSLESFRNFLENRFRTLELTEPVKLKTVSATVREKTFHVTANEIKKIICKMCNENHSLSHCKTFGKYTPSERSNFITTNNLCFNCLASGHSVRYCRIPTSCRLCRRRHHTLLHETIDKNTTTSGNTNNTANEQPGVALHTNMEKIEEEEEEDITMVASHISTKQSTALLATAIVQVRSEDNYSTTLRALIDQGSQASFISERAAQLLKAKRYPIKGTVVGVGSTREDIKQVVQLNLQSTCETSSLEVRTYIMSKQLTTKIPSQTIKTSSWPHLKGLILADPDYYKPGSIDLLLGVDVYTQIIQNELIKGPPGSPCAHKTMLGWILFGKVEDTTPQPDSILVMHHQVMVEDFLKTLWEVEQGTTRKQTKEEQQCENHYEQNYKRDSSGRYIVRLPFCYNTPIAPSGNSRAIVMKRLIQQERRLQQTPELRKEYDKVLEEYLTMGHMEQVPEDEINKPSVYLPHHAVVRTDKETTKTRVVFDASCKYNKGVSLNDELLTWPVLQEDMRSTLMKWRMHKICFASDIIKMYRMVLLDERDRDYQRILWRRPHTESEETITENIEVKDYRLRTVTFGTASAPYLAVKTLMKLAEDEGEPYPEAARIIREDFYVDDLTSGCDTTEKAIEISKQIVTILKKGGFELQKWASNDTEFLKSIDADKVTTKANLDIKLDGVIKALGLSWNLGEDEFHYQIHLEPATTITKRTILSDLQKLFDPLGWIAPAIVTAKIFVQKLWLEGIGWDQEVGNEMEEEWKSIRKDLENVNKIRIKRWLDTLSTERQQITLHGFCDASEKAYGAVVYCRVKRNDGQIKTHLVAARTKVAPVKTISLPRLELCGAGLLSKLLHQARQAMRIQTENVYAWTDSTIVLAWLLGKPNRWKPFVANRVVEILEQTSNSQWFHVQSGYNPADIASRGLPVSELRHKILWWTGPDWLTEEPIELVRPATLGTDIERKKTILSHVQVTESEKKVINFENYNSLTELLKTIVYCKKFLNMKKNPKGLEYGITTELMQNALDICIRQVQEEEFSEDIRRLREKQTVKKTSILKSLNPFIDENNILRVGGRLRHADAEYNLKHPIILGKRNGLIPAEVLADAHLKTMHGGIKIMTTYLMSRYWIVSCKNMVKLYTQKCLTCVRQRAASKQQIMGDLPEPRVTPARPFSRCGIDFAGPVYVLKSRGRGAKTNKAYICIFICMAVKAIHLELVSDLTSAAFIAAFKRFVARRGRCNEVWSDNGTNFVAANKELCTTWKEAQLEIPDHVSNQLTTDGTQWHFIPPYSPNFGGLWEAGVKSVKQHLRKILTSNLTFEEFTTVLTQIEACLNSRPLTSIPTNVDTIDDIQVITPGHFLIGEALINIPERNYESSNINLLSRWQHAQRLVQGFWKRWQTEYLTQLNQRPKWLKRTTEYEIGDIVLVRGENMPPSKWPLARIIAKHPGQDNVTRVYTVRCNNKTMKRSISALCTLPIYTGE